MHPHKTNEINEINERGNDGVELDCKLVHAAEGLPFLTTDLLYTQKGDAPTHKQAGGFHRRTLEMSEWEKTLITANGVCVAFDGRTMRAHCENHPEFWLQLRFGEDGWKVIAGCHTKPSRAVTYCGKGMALPKPLVSSKWTLEDTGDMLIVGDEAHPTFRCEISMK